MEERTMNVETAVRAAASTELSLMDSEQRYKRLLASVTDYVYTVIVHDGHTVATVHGPGCEAVTGFTTEEFEADQSLWYRMIFEEDRSAVLSQVDRILRGETPPPLEHRIIHKNGSVRWIRNTPVPRKSPEGRLVAYDGLVYDITDRKQAEEQLTLAYAELAANEEALRRTVDELKHAHDELKKTQLQLIQAAKLESVGALAAGVAHEVKNPLQTILMGLDYLTGTVPPGNELVASVLTDMRDAVMRANTIIRGLLQLAAGSDFDPKPEDLNVCIKRALRLVNAQTIAAKIVVNRRLDPHLPPVLIDPGKIEQVFINLFLNGLQAMNPGGVLTVSTQAGVCGELHKSGELIPPPFARGDRVVVSEVQDTGTGILKENLPKVFDPFYTTKPAGVGTGLGLSVAKKIVDLHGGAIEIQNAPSCGVVVILTLRAHRE
jgi:PAS domain S-box-containing protein